MWSLGSDGRAECTSRTGVERGGGGTPFADLTAERSSGPRADRFPSIHPSWFRGIPRADTVRRARTPFDARGVRPRGLLGFYGTGARGPLRNRVFIAVINTERTKREHVGRGQCV